MELPDDVLQLIREYAKPWFKYHNIYKRTLKIMGLEYCPYLRICLYNYPDQILPVLVELEKAYSDLLIMIDQYNETPSDFYKREYYRRNKNWLVSQREVNCTIRALLYV